jgi:hypothetical protein
LLIFQYCRALYAFDSIDETTMSVKEGENLKILQKHDDNFNDEWWLLEKIISEKSHQNDNIMIRGYVPSNYVQLIYRAEIKKDSSDVIVLYND